MTTVKGTWQTSLWTAPSPPSKGAVQVMYRVKDALGESSADDLTIVVVPWMPAHGHGTSVRAEVFPEGDGWYLVKPIYFYMSGRWELRTTLTGQAQTNDSIVPVFDIL